MLDSYAIATHYREPVNHGYRFAGAGNVAPTAVANCPDALRATLTRSNVGTLSLNTTENSGQVQFYTAEVQQPPGSVGLKDVFIGPPTAGAYPITFAMQVVYAGNGANVDLAVGEELTITIDRSLGRAT